MKDLVEFLVKPFLEEDTNLEYDNCVPATKEGDDFLKNKKNLPKLKKFLENNRKRITENLITQLVDGGTNELSPFASVEGYYKYSLMRSENCGYEFLQDTFDPKYVYGNEKSGPPKEIHDSELQAILEAYNQIDKLYLEYALHINDQDNLSVENVDDYNSDAGEFGDTSKLEKQKTLPLHKAVGNDYDGYPSDTTVNYKHKYDKTPKGRHI